MVNRLLYAAIIDIPLLATLFKQKFIAVLVGLYSQLVNSKKSIFIFSENSTSFELRNRSFDFLEQDNNSEVNYV